MINIEIAPRPCPICKTETNSKLFSECNLDPSQLDESSFASRKLPEYMHWRLVLCSKCDLLYANPAPTPDALATLYKNAQYSSKAEAALASRTYARMLAKHLKRLPNLNSAVDIGTGEGSFLLELQKLGFLQVSGYEPSIAPIEMAAPEVRKLIVHATFQKKTLPDHSQSLITCFQTIEHLSDPLEFCQDAFRALIPGGMLFLIGHNRQALSAKIMGRKSPIFDVEHLQLFSFKSISNLAKAAGFRDISAQILTNSYPLNYWAKLFPLPKLVKPLTLAFLQRTHLGRLPIKLPAGNMALVAIK